MNELTRLFSIAVSSCREGKSTTDYESSFVDCLAYFEEHPDLRPQAEAVFLDALRTIPTRPALGRHQG